MTRSFFAALAALALVCALPAAAANVTSTTCTDAPATDTGCAIFNVGPTVASVSVQIGGTFVATLLFEGTTDSTTWVSVNAFPVPSGGPVQSTAAVGIWALDATSVSRVRVRASAYTSGTAVVVFAPSDGPLRSQLIGPQFSCFVAASTATTLTAFGGSCATPGAGKSLYITDVSFSSSSAAGTAADSFPTIKSGTGGTCGAATAVVWAALNAANTPVVQAMVTPIKVAANSEICWIDSTAGTRTVTVNGFIAP